MVEIETCAPIRELRRKGVVKVVLAGWGNPPDCKVLQVQANVVDPSQLSTISIVESAAKLAHSVRRR
jgi:hypothetical protein